MPSSQRRHFLQSVSAGVMGYGLAELTALQALAARDIGPSRVAAAKQVLVVYEEGGVSQMDTWDPKPDAPVEHRTPYSPIATSVPGVHFSEIMPLLAQQAHRLSVVRSMTTAKVAGHKEGCQEFFKGHQFGVADRFPDIGSVVTELLGTDCPQLPGYIFCPGANMPNHITTTGFLHRARAPWKLGTKSLGEDLSKADWKVASLSPAEGLSESRFQRRRELLASVNSTDGIDTARADVLRQQYENAFDLLTSERVQSAFQLKTESDHTRDRYGRDHRGCCYLLGRKLIEAGVRFVSVTAIQPPDHVKRPNIGQPNGVFLNWDHHEGIYRNGPCGGPQAERNQERYGLPHPIMMPSLDRSLSALIEDMHERGLLEETLLCFVTEMGRTPRMNKWQGRDHWGRAMSIAFAGAGVPAGQIVGATDREAGDVTDRLYTPYDYAATVYHKLGIDTERGLKDAGDRPIPMTDGGHPIPELI
jgi:hypothetical protein